MYYLSIQKVSEGQKIALLRKGKKQFFIDKLTTLNSDVKPLYNLKALLQKKPFKTVTGLSSDHVFLRKISLKLKSKREILKTLPFQVESLLPYPLEEAILLPTLLPQEKGTDVSLLAATLRDLENHLSEQELSDIDPDIVSCVPLGLSRFASHFCPQVSDLLVCHIDEKETSMIAIGHGKLQASQMKNFGREDLLLDESKFSHQMDRMLTYFTTKYPGVENILVTGKLDEIEEKIQSILPKNLIFLEVAHSFREYAVPIGLCLDAAKNDKESAQFRQKGMLSQKQLSKRKKSLNLYIAACTCAFLIPLVFGTHSLDKKEKRLLSQIDAPNGTPLSEAIFQLEKSTLNKNRSPISVPNVPTLSETLLWISTHPKLQNGMKVEDFRYQLVKFPKLGSLVANYSAKIEIELSAPSPKELREFHEALLIDKKMVLQKQGIKWQADRTTCKASFFLKTKGKQ